MFAVKIVGQVCGMFSTKDGKHSFLTIATEVDPRRPLRQGDTLKPTNVEIPAGVDAGAAGLRKRVEVDAYGYMADVDWYDKQKNVTKKIENTRLVASAIKLIG